VKDGEPDFSTYTSEQIERSLRNIDREKYPLNYANLVAAQRLLPVLSMDAASIAAREQARLIENVASGKVWISAPALFTFWLPCLSRILVQGDSLEIRSPFQVDKVLLKDIALVRWFDAQPLGEWHLAAIESRRGARIRLLPRSRALIRAFAAHVSAVQGGVDVADPNYQSLFSIGGADP
jgi:hypothetical protein